MRVVGAAFRRQARGGSALDLGGKSGDGRRAGRRPTGSAAAPLEDADAAKPISNGSGADAAERQRDVVGERPLNLADEAQGDVQLFVRNPAQFGAIGHCVNQQVADVPGWTDSDEQAVHGAAIASFGAIARCIAAGFLDKRPTRAANRQTDFVDVARWPVESRARGRFGTRIPGMSVTGGTDEHDDAGLELGRRDGAGGLKSATRRPLRSQSGPASQNRRETKYCISYEDVTGSRTSGGKVCRTRAQWASDGIDIDNPAKDQ